MWEVGVSIAQGVMAHAVLQVAQAEDWARLQAAWVRAPHLRPARLLRRRIAPACRYSEAITVKG